MRIRGGNSFVRIQGMLLLLLVAAFLVLAGCGDGIGGSDDDDDDDAGDDDDDDVFGDDDTGDDDDAGDDDDDAGDDDDDDDDTSPPPVPEEDVDPGTRPRICGGAVYVLSTEGDFVSRIDAQTLDVDTIEVGRQPTILRATSDCNAMITLNSGDDTVSLIDMEDNGVTELLVRPDLNELKIDPTGRFALAYHHFTSGKQGKSGYGEISIIDITQGSVQSMAVGFPPDGVVFTQDQRAILFSETTLGLVGLTDASYANLPTGLNIEEGQKLRKVAVSSGGDYAFLLAEASTILLALDLTNVTLVEVELGCYPTDLDVAENGDIALMLCREDGAISVLDVENLLFEQYITQEVVGSGVLNESGDLAILFTSALPIEKVHLFHTSTGDMESYFTVKPLIGAAIAPQDRGAVLFHYGGDGEPIDNFDEYFDTREAFSLMNLVDGRINPVELPDTPLLVSFGDDGRHGVIPIPQHRQVILLDLVGGLADVIVPPSQPLEVGVLSDLGKVFVLQYHPLGRISFYDTATLEARTITGFLLNGGIEE